MINHKELESVEFLKSSSDFRYEGKTKDLWWPFWAWRIVAPKDAEEADVFLELILRLINAGCKDRKRISELSCLEEEFVAHLLVLLTDRGYIDNWQITDAGKSYLDKGYRAVEELRSFYILQDSGTKKVLPRIFEKMAYIENIAFDGDYPCFVQNRKSGKLIKPFLIREISDQIQTPSAETLYEAIKSHRRDRNKLKQAGFDVRLIDLTVDQVSLLDDKPVAVYMSMKIFMDNSGERAWYLSDPSGMMPSLPELNDAADERIKRDKSFAKYIDDYLGDSSNEKGFSYLEKLRMIDEQANAQLMSNYPWAGKIPIVEKYVLLMLKKKITLDLVKRPESLEELLDALQKVCEAIMKILINPNNSKAEWEVLACPEEYQKGKSRLKDIGREQKKSLYIQNGIVDETIAWDLSGVKYGQVKEAMHSGDQSLRQLIAAFVLCHPSIVKDLNTALPKWLESMLLLAAARNKKSAHANMEQQNLDEVKSYESFVDSLLKYIEGN